MTARTPVMSTGGEIAVGGDDSTGDREAMSIEITSWLRGLGLEQFATAFLANDIDAEILPKLTADDLIGLGVTSIGHRRKLLDAIATLRDGSPISSTPSRRPSRCDEAEMLASLPAPPSVGSSLSCSAIWSAQPRWHLASIRKICGRCSALITPP